MITRNSCVSIIVPVYNAEPFLSPGIDSILAQSFTDFELLLIDDGSTDGSGAICEAYAAKDSRVRVFHKKNGGVSSARNLGLDEATGEFVFFADADDLIPPAALSALMACMDDATDMTLGGFSKFGDGDREEQEETIGQSMVLNQNDCLDLFLPRPEDFEGKEWQRYMVNRLYRLSAIRHHQLRFRTDIFYKEDGLFLVQYICRCVRRAVMIPDIVYRYRQVSESAMGRLNTAYNRRLMTNLDAHVAICRELKHHRVGQDLLEREYNHLFHTYRWMKSIMCKSSAYTLANRCRMYGKILKACGPHAFFVHVFAPGRVRLHAGTSAA
ncbi:MAG: glycosyltransferase [Bacteroidales bacterium]|nr:glycosyltransferase [Bacteroidales bacterium]